MKGISGSSVATDPGELRPDHCTRRHMESQAGVSNWLRHKQTCGSLVNAVLATRLSLTESILLLQSPYPRYPVLFDFPHLSLVVVWAFPALWVVLTFLANYPAIGPRDLARCSRELLRFSAHQFSYQTFSLLP